MKPIVLLIIFAIFAFSINCKAQRIRTDNVQNSEGRKIYVSNCARCHNLNPTKQGSIGPELYTTPLDVFRTKVPTGTYPSGYKPKRRSKIMPKFQSLKNKVDLIHDYIKSFKSV